jgi:polyhydroxyalkanoate synthesis regulator phasin
VFDQEKIAQTVSNLARDYTTANMTVMKTTMEQFEKTMNTLIKQGTVAQDEGTKLFADWWNRVKQGQQQYYNIMEDGLKNMENLFGTTDGQKRATK